MKQHSILLFFVFLSVILASCSEKDEPEPLVYMMPSSILSDNANGASQTFSYDSYGRIISWKQKYNAQVVTATFSYPDNNTIVAKSTEIFPDQERTFNETITLDKGRAIKSEGTFVADFKNGASPFLKTYRLEFDYDNFTDNLTEVKHSEVVGIGEDVTDASWEKAWTWSDYLYWEDGNLKEYQNFQGLSSIQQTVKYDYSIYDVFYPVIIPPVINSYHHLPLFMQGVFGLNSNNFVSRASYLDAAGNITRTFDYSYEFENGYVKTYTETFCNGEAISSPITYNVTWTAK